MKIKYSGSAGDIEGETLNFLKNQVSKAVGENISDA